MTLISDSIFFKRAVAALNIFVIYAVIVGIFCLCCKNVLVADLIVGIPLITMLFLRISHYLNVCKFI